MSTNFFPSTGDPYMFAVGLNPSTIVEELDPEPVTEDEDPSSEDLPA